MPKNAPKISALTLEYLRLEKDATELEADLHDAHSSAERDFKEIALHEIRCEASKRLLDLLEYLYAQPPEQDLNKLVDDLREQILKRRKEQP
jgi:hypothetical protein